MVWGSTQPLTEETTRDIAWEIKAAGADILEFLGASTSSSPKVLPRPV